MNFWQILGNISIIIGIANGIAAIIGVFYPSTPSTTKKKSTKKLLIGVGFPLAIILICAGIVPHTALYHSEKQVQTNTITPTSKDNTPNIPPTPSTDTTPFSYTTETQNTTSLPTPGSLLYQADWSEGADRWNLEGSGWSVLGNGSIVSTSTGNNPILIFAPYQPSTRNYAVEVQARAVNEYNAPLFYIIVRNDGTQYGGYQEKIPYTDLEGSPPGTVDTTWHKYRVEVQYNQITLLIDGQRHDQEIDNTYLQPGQVGLMAFNTQMEVRSFKVFAL